MIDNILLTVSKWLKHYELDVERKWNHTSCWTNWSLNGYIYVLVSVSAIFYNFSNESMVSQRERIKPTHTNTNASVENVKADKVQIIPMTFFISPWQFVSLHYLLLCKNGFFIGKSENENRHCSSAACTFYF